MLIYLCLDRLIFETSSTYAHFYHTGCPLPFAGQTKGGWFLSRTVSANQLNLLCPWMLFGFAFKLSLPLWYRISCTLTFPLFIYRSKLYTYDDVVERIARHLGVDDPSKIRLTPHNCYSQQPKPQPIKYRGVEHLSDMLVHYNQVCFFLQSL